MITVYSSFEILNGLSGMQRDIVLHLCNLFFDRIEKVRAIFGISEEHYSWRKHSIFLRGRPIRLPVYFRQNRMLVFGIKSSPDGKFHTLNAGSFVRTVFVDMVLTGGVFCWTVFVPCSRMTNFLFRIGASPLRLIYQCDDKALGLQVPGTCAFGCNGFGDAKKNSWETKLEGLKGGAVVSCEESPLLCNSYVAVEADCTAGTLSFSVSGRKVSHVVTGLQTPLILGMSAREAFVTSCTFFRFPTASRSRMLCRLYACST